MFAISGRSFVFVAENRGDSKSVASALEPGGRISTTENQPQYLAKYLRLTASDADFAAENPETVAGLGVDASS